MDDNFFLHLSSDYIQFEASASDHLVSGTSVFFDETNQQIFVVKDKGVGGINVRGPDSKSDLHFCLEEKKGDIFSIKFSATCSILAVQRTPHSVDFFNFENGLPLHEYSQSCRGKGHILGFCWTGLTEIVFITNSSLELYQVIPDKKQLKSLRVFSLSVSWYIYSPLSSVLVVSTGGSSHVLQTLQFTSGTMYKLSKFEVDLGIRRNPTQKKSLLERDVCIASLYGKLCLLILRHDQTQHDMTGTQVMIYTFQKDGPPKKSHVLELELTGRFAMSILDNLVIIHHQTSQTSLVFDIRFPVFKSEGGCFYHRPVVPPYSIRPFQLPDQTSVEMYSSNWVIFQPNIIIDARLGCLWRLELKLENIRKMISSPAFVVDFLLLRRNSKQLLIEISKEAVCGQLWSPNGHLMGTLSLLFSKFNQAWKMANHLKETATSRSSFDVDFTPVTLDQCDMYSHVFSLFDAGETSSSPSSSSSFPDDFAAAVLFEYINSLVQYEVPIQFSTYERIINLLVKSKKFFQLQQFMQYHVFTDSKPLACLLLSLQVFYKNALQLALDMFKRLSVGQEDLVDVYLSMSSQFAVTRALRYVQMQDKMESVSARKFLEVAKNSLDPKLYFLVYRHFELRNLNTRGHPDFAKGEQCDSFVKDFQETFGIESSLEPFILSKD